MVDTKRQGYFSGKTHKVPWSNMDSTRVESWLGLGNSFNQYGFSLFRQFIGGYPAAGYSDPYNWPNLPKSIKDTFWPQSSKSTSAGSLAALQKVWTDTATEVYRPYYGPVQEKKSTAMTGFNCCKCNSRNDFAEANQSDGTYVCYSCR